MAPRCTRGGLYWISGKMYTSKSLSHSVTGCLGLWQNHCPWRDLKVVQMGHLGTWFKDGLGSVRSVIFCIFSNINGSKTLNRKENNENLVFHWGGERKKCEHNNKQ